MAYALLNYWLCNSSQYFSLYYFVPISTSFKAPCAVDGWEPNTTLCLVEKSLEKGGRLWSTKKLITALPWVLVLLCDKSATVLTDKWVIDSFSYLFSSQLLIFFETRSRIILIYINHSFFFNSYDCFITDALLGFEGGQGSSDEGKGNESRGYSYNDNIVRGWNIRIPNL